MSTQEIIELVLSYLPDSISDSPLFMELKEKCLNVPEGSTIMGSIYIRRPLYEEIISDHPELSSIIKPSDRKMLRIVYFRENIITLDIFGDQDNYNIVIREALNNTEKKDSIECFDGMKIVRSIIERHKKGYCIDFHEEMKCYDEDDNLIPHDDKETECFDEEGRLVSLDYESMLDDDFVDRFKVPVAMARILRTNFQRFQDKINRVCTIEKQESYESDLDVELLDFTGPYSVENFKDSYINYNMQQTFLNLQAAGYDDPEDAFNTKYANVKLIDSIGRNLLAQIGPGDIVISSNITEMLDSVVTGFEPAIVYTKGIIIKKSDNGFIMYYAHIENESVILIPQELTADEAKELYKRGMHYENEDALKDFFGFNRGI